MIKNPKSLYEVKLILDHLSKEEYELIPKEDINYINDNFEYDENIVIDSKVPLDKQNISEEAYEILDKILLKINKFEFAKNEKEEVAKYINKVKKENKEFEIEIENIKLNNILEVLKKENQKLPKAKELVEEYQELLNDKENFIKQLKEENEYLNIQKDQALNMLNKIPNIIKNVFIKKETLKLLNSNENN